MTTTSVRRSIFDAIGGMPAVVAATDLLYQRLLADPLVSRHFVGVDLPRLRDHMRAFLAAALGGPAAYRGRDLAPAHADLGITGADWDATVGHLVATLAELRVTEDLIDQIATRVLPLREVIVTADSFSSPATLMPPL